MILEGVNDGEPWRIEIECDRMADTEPFTVSVWVADNMEDTMLNDVAGAFLSSFEARAVAAALCRAAADVDRNNARPEIKAHIAAAVAESRKEAP